MRINKNIPNYIYNLDISIYITSAPYFYGYNRNLHNRFLTFQVLKQHV